MKKIAILYSSPYGHTEVLARKIAEGAAIEGKTSAILINVAAITAENVSSLREYDAMIFGTPTYMGSTSAEFKTFMDITSAEWFTQNWKDKFAAGFTNSSSFSGDKLNTLQSLMIFASQHSMVWISQGIFPTGQTETDLNRLGSWAGLMAQSANASTEITPPEGDRNTAVMFGKRIANFLVEYVK